MRIVWLFELDEMLLCNIYLLSHENLSGVVDRFRNSVVACQRGDELGAEGGVISASRYLLLAL